jgi:undecaprenyl-diphosphatase
MKRTDRPGVKRRSFFLLTGFNLSIIGFVTAFVVALLTIQFLLQFIKTHTFIPFGLCRIVLVASGFCS